MSEAKIQQAVAVWARAQPFPACLLHSVLSGAHLAGGGRQWGFLVAQGAMSGLPDLLLPVARGKYNNLWIELKTPIGRLSKRQAQVHSWLAEAGARVVVCRSAEEAIACIKDYLSIG